MSRKKFLIIRFSSIGDIVLTTPVIRCLKKKYPDAEIHYLTKEVFKNILIPNPNIDKVFSLGLSREILIHDLQSENYDYVIDLHKNIRSWRIKRQLGIKSFSFSKLNIEKWIFTNLKWNLLPKVHIVDRYLNTIKELDVQNDGEGLDYFLSESDYVSNKDIPVSHQAGYIGIVIGAAHNTKKLPVEKLRKLCELIQHPIILLGGKEDRDAGEFIASSDPVKVYNSCGKFSINESADLVRRSRMVVTHDTGLMHIAAAFKKPVISIWGNTVPAFGMYPYYGEKYISKGIENDIIEVKELRCRPCSKIGHEKCPKTHFKCMEHISEEEILQKIMRYLSSNDIKSKISV
jgi:ADP-heptose:LPS heptosyltransferase